jgi:hypothetical protein
MKIFFNKKIKLIFFLVLFSLALISVIHSFNESQKYSYDFHYYPTKLVSEGINHYQYVLDGKHDRGPADRMLYSQDGIYGHGLFIALLPLTLLDWDTAKTVWAFLNILFCFFILFFLRKKFRLRKNIFIVSACLFLMSTPLRINIGYGQQTLFTFLFFLLPFVFRGKISMILSGLSYFKYNIGYVLFIYIFFQKNINKVLISLIPCIIGWLSYAYITNTSALKNLFEPFLVLGHFFSITNHLPVTIFSLLKEIGFNNYLVMAIPLILSFLVIYKLKEVKNDLFKLSIVCLVSLSFTAHQLHDYILLLPLLIFSLINFNLLVSKINLIVIFYFFFFLRIISLFFNFMPWDFPYGYFGYLNNSLIILILFLNFENLKIKFK